MPEYKSRFITPKYILFIVIVGCFCFLIGIGSSFIIESILPGLILVPIGAYLVFSHTGFDIDLKKRRFRHFTSHFGIKKGRWDKFKYYPYLALLSMRTKQTKYSFSGVPFSSKSMSYRVHLLNEKHTRKILIKEFQNKLEAETFMEQVSKELSLEIQSYHPDFT